MLPATERCIPNADKRRHIIVALDVERESEALGIAAELHGTVAAFKIGLQLFTACGPNIVSRFVDKGYRVFLDLKFHDIPNTVAKASIEAARLGVWMFNIHASGGSRMMQTAVEEVSKFCERENVQKPLMIAVTVLTSSDAASLEEQGMTGSIDMVVTRLSELAAEAGMDGVVASAREVELIKGAIGSKDLLTITPGIRPASATVDDQKRVTTLSTALSAGTDYVVIGRPITGASDKKEALDRMLEELSQ